MPSPYDSTKHHPTGTLRSRRSIRLKAYDYSTPGAYFITAVVKQRTCILSEIHDGALTLTPLGEIVNQCWNALPQRFPSAELDAFVIMPNHFHGVIRLTDESARDGVVWATLAVVPHARVVRDARERAGASPAPTKPTLGDIVGAFKSQCFTVWYDYIKQNDLNIVAKFWQRNYYEHIVRDQKELDRVRAYIEANPFRWEYDREKPKAKPVKDSWLSDEKIWFSTSNVKSSNA